MAGSNEKKVLYKTEMTLPCAHCRNVLLALDHSDRIFITSDVKSLIYLLKDVNTQSNGTSKT